MKRLGKALAPITALAVGAGLSLSATPAQAATGAYAGQASGEVLQVQANLLNLPPLATLAVGAVGTSVDSALSGADASARSANGSASLLGLGLTLDEMSTSAGPPSDPAGRNLAAINVAPLANLGLINGDVGAYYVSDERCPALTPQGRVVADAHNSVASVTVGTVPSGTDTLVSAGVASKTARTRLVPMGDEKYGLESSVRSSIGAVKLLGERVQVRLSDDVVLRSLSNGSTGESSINNVLAQVFVDGVLAGSVRVGSGEAVTVPVKLGLLNASVTVRAGTFSDQDSGATAAASLTAVADIAVTVDNVTSARLTIGGAAANAKSPVGGVACNSGSSTDSDGDGLTDEEENDLGTNPNSTDSDDDGLSDQVEAQHGTDPNKWDSDGDGLGDGVEVAVGSLPTDTDTDNGGASDGVEVSMGTDPLNPNDDKPSGVPNDSDNDGLSDADEARLGTSPTNPDTDGDRLTDGAEVNTFKTDPLKKDTDDDGLNDEKEIALTTNPNRPDTDNDGLSDGREVLTPASTTYSKCFTDPLKKDTDGDKIKDGREVKGSKINLVVKTRKGVSKMKRVRTNPCLADTDRDGLKDKVEIRGYRINQTVLARKGKGKTYTYKIGKVRSNPLMRDTDRDGLRDKAEKTGSKNKRFKRAKSSPINWDTDMGGISDGKEVKRKTNPSSVRSGRA